MDPTLIDDRPAAQIGVGEVELDFGAGDHLRRHFAGFSVVSVGTVFAVTAADGFPAQADLGILRISVEVDIAAAAAVTVCDRIITPLTSSS